MKSFLSPVLLGNLVLISVAVILGWSRDPARFSRYFDEGRFPMIFSCLQLAAVAVLAVGIYRRRRTLSAARGWRAGYQLWGLIAAGFVFLALDEGFQFHEQIDHWVHSAANWKETDLSDRLDDLLIGGYALIGLGVLAIYRREMAAARVMLRPLILGFVFTGISVVGDALGHHPDGFLAMGAQKRDARLLVEIFEVLEGGFMLLAEGCFVVAFCLAYRHFRPPPPARRAAP